MIKLFTLKNLSAFSADAVYKICLSLEKYGLTDENSLSFESYDELFDSALYALQDGDSAVVAVDTADFCAVKRELIGKFLLDEYSSPNIAEKIAQSADDGSEIDMAEQCLIPRAAKFHLSSDGLFSGFSCPVLNGTLTFLPLDFVRIDAVIESFIGDVLEEKPSEEEKSAPEEEKPTFEEAEATESEDEEKTELQKIVEQTVSALLQLGKTAALATGEATMDIYNLYNKVDGLSDVFNFVEIVDDDETNSENGEESEELKESESVKTIRHAREAMFNTQADFGAAVSEVFSSENEDGTKNYFAYIALAEKNHAKAKKINTTNPDDVEMILSHCSAILCDTLLQKLEELHQSAQEKEEAQKTPSEKKEEKKLSKGMMIFVAAVLVVAAISPIVILKLIWNKEDSTPTVPFQTTQGQLQSTDPASLQSSTNSAFPGITTPSQNVVASTQNGLTAKEPTATEYSASATAAPQPSTSGKFTFYVFGYGHGVGMSQNGANYLAKQGWDYAQILANYYYGAVLVSGDTYPATINYNGSDYQTREYLASALESEMGSSFEKEALKAQAVALYTFAKYYDYKLTADSNAFGKTPSSASYAAVDEIMKYGLYIASSGTETALTPFHAISAGITTSFYNVWGGTAVPYLGGGRLSYGDYEATGFKSTYSISSEDLKKIVKEKLKVDLSGDPSTWITIISHDRAVNENVGYVSSMNIGGKVISGNDFRVKVLEGKIRSHCFMLVYTPDEA